MSGPAEPCVLCAAQIHDRESALIWARDLMAQPGARDPIPWDASRRERVYIGPPVRRPRIKPTRRFTTREAAVALLADDWQMPDEIGHRLGKSVGSVQRALQRAKVAGAAIESSTLGWRRRTA